MNRSIVIHLVITDSREAAEQKTVAATSPTAHCFCGTLRLASPHHPGLCYLPFDVSHTYCFAITVTNAKASNGRPPKFGEYLLHFFLDKTERSAVPGDLEEEYKEILGKFGPKPANIWFYKQVIWSILPLTRKALLKWGTILSVAKLIQRYINSH